MEKIPVWFIDASTGCSCCAEDNFVAGPFFTEESAQATAKLYFDSKRLASQYASHGRYHIRKEEGEKLPDGRIIVGRHVYDHEGEEHREDYA